jgi:uncharacterized protein YggE
MLIRQFTSLLLLSAVPLAAQIVNNTVTVTASQSSTAQPDEAVFSVAVGSGVDKSLDDAVAAVSSLGITAANLATVNSVLPLNRLGTAPPPAPTLNWVFQLVVPLAKSKDTTAGLASLQKTISQSNNGLTLSFTLSGTQTSAQQTPSCNLADLVSKARAQAQDIAGAAGFKAGAIVGLTSATSNAASAFCSLTVRFALGMMFGQPGPNSIAITATRANAIQPDQVLIGLNVQSPTTAGLDDIAGALTGAGIPGANFTQVYTTTIYPTSGSPPMPQAALAWSFSLTAPLAKLSATLTQILSAQQAISGNNSGLTLNFYLQGMQVSPQLQQSQPCSQAALLADAQARAKSVAAAAGVSAGSILSTSEASFGTAALQVVPAYQPVPANLVVGSFGYASFATSNVFTTPQPTCSLTVQFQLM